MPRVPPVTTATFPVRSKRSTPSSWRRGDAVVAGCSEPTDAAVPLPVCQPGPMGPADDGRTALGATSEVGRLRTVLLHRPGAELSRLTPRNNDQLLFDGVPWVARAQEEHDAFAAALR